ncbi:MAG: TetR/AcrR family transcriptional regulator [Roseovarius sp.]
MSVREIENVKPKRRDPKGHRQALITAVLDLVAQRGVPETTVSRIIEQAGLSRGMIHLHFGGKDGLLITAARHFSESYAAQVEARLAKAGPAPADIVMAAIRADLSDEILTPRSARLWHGFRGIANPAPEIAQCCGTRGGQVKDALERAFLALAQQDSVPDATQLARDASFGTMALLEGMCADYLANLETFSRRDAERVILLFLAGIFPQHF